MKLKNKVAVITGGSRGLGKVISECFLKEGAKVFICSRHEEELNATLAEFAQKGYRDSEVFGIRADVSIENDTLNIASNCFKRFKKIDILVNNAGIHGAKGEIDQLDLSQWKKAIEVNLFGMVHMVRAVLPEMKRQGEGKIINISGGGATSPRPYFSAYAASKTAIVRLTENFAVELAKYNIMVNAIAPGAMNTYLLEDILTAGEELIGKEYQKALYQKKEGGVNPEIAAKLCVKLASQEGDGLSGKLFSAVWDDWNAILEHKRELNDTDIYTLRRIVPEDREEK